MIYFRSLEKISNNSKPRISEISKLELSRDRQIFTFSSLITESLYRYTVQCSRVHAYVRDDDVWNIVPALSSLFLTTRIIGSDRTMPTTCVYARNFKANIKKKKKKKKKKKERRRREELEKLPGLGSCAGCTTNNESFDPRNVEKCIGSGTRPMLP